MQKTPDISYEARFVKQVLPLRIVLLNQIDLPLAFPAFHTFLSIDSIANIPVLLEIDQPVHPVFLGESFDGIGLVLMHPVQEVVGYADVQRAVLPAGQDIHKVSMISTHALFLDACLRRHDIGGVSLLGFGSSCRWDSFIMTSWFTLAWSSLCQSPAGVSFLLRPLSLLRRQESIAKVSGFPRGRE